MAEDRKSLCKCAGCSFEPEHGQDYCILHCEKSVPYDYAGFERFKSFFLKYLDQQWKKIGERYGRKTNALSMPDEEFERAYNILNKELSNLLNEWEHEKLHSITKKIGVHFDIVDVIFPSFTYANNRLTEIEYLPESIFTRCSYSIPAEAISSPYVQFKNCEFGSFFVAIEELGRCVHEYKFIKCNFDNLSLIHSYKKNDRFSEVSPNIKCTLFRNCKFNELFFEIGTYSNFTFSLFKNVGNKTSIEFLRIERSMFPFHLNLNKQICKRISLRSSTFSKSVELSQATLNELALIDCTFEGTVNLGFNIFDSFALENTIFKNIAILEGSQFKKDTLFNNVVFHESVNMRETVFEQKLDLRRSIFNRTLNCLGITIQSKSVGRETYRIIKNSFDTIGNKIEANRFYSKEMSSYRDELCKKQFDWRNWSEIVLTGLNKITSNFGQSYIYPLIWILFFAMLHFQFWKYAGTGHYSGHSLLTNINIFITKAFPLFGSKGVKNEGFEFLGFLFYLVYSGLIYQFIVALKKHSKR